MSGSMADRQSERFKLLDSQIIVTSLSGENYRFKIPSMAEYAAIGSRAAAYRRAADPGLIGDIRSLDWQTADAYWAFAAFEVLLDKTSVEWPVSKTADGSPVVDHRKFPFDRFDELLEVTRELDQALIRFRERGAANGRSGAAQAVDASQGPGTP